MAIFLQNGPHCAHHHWSCTMKRNSQWQENYIFHKVMQRHLDTKGKSILLCQRQNHVKPNATNLLLMIYDLDDDFDTFQFLPLR